MNIDGLTIKEARELARMFGGSGSGSRARSQVARPGDKVLVRTVAPHYLGEVVAINDDVIMLRICSWIAETGKRLGVVLSQGVQPETEVEAWPPDTLVCVMLDTVLDVSIWPHDLPRGSQ